METSHDPRLASQLRCNNFENVFCQPLSRRSQLWFWLDNVDSRLVVAVNNQNYDLQIKQTFEENVETPTLNTDIIASISRDGGSNYTNATLSDSGYVTGSSGQRILTGQATISGQPSGQSMRWKLALANNAVKIHGVSLSWA